MTCAIAVMVMLNAGVVKADELPVTSGEVTIGTLMTCNTPDTAYDLEIKKSGTLTLTLSVGNHGFNWGDNGNITIYDEAGNIVYKDSATFSDSVLNSVKKIQLVAGNYVVYIHGYIQKASGTFDVSYRFDFKEAKETVADSTMDKHNSILTSGQMKKSSIDGFFALNDNKDVFAYKASKNGNMIFKFKTLEVNRLGVKVYSAEGGEVYTMEEIPTGTSTYQFPIKKGTYYIEITGEPGSYSLSTSIGKMPTIKFKSVKANRYYAQIDTSWTQKDNAAGYQIQVANNKKFKKATTIDLDNYYSTYNLDNYNADIQAKKTYYVRIRIVYDCGEEQIYSNWSSAKSVKTK